MKLAPVLPIFHSPLAQVDLATRLPRPRMHPIAYLLRIYLYGVCFDARASSCKELPTVTSRQGSVVSSIGFLRN